MFRLIGVVTVFIDDRVLKAKVRSKKRVPMKWSEKITIFNKNRLARETIFTYRYLPLNFNNESIIL